jgi:hypothetical protein
VYQLTQLSGVIRISDNAFIPDAPNNTDWQAYQQWVAEGNVADSLRQSRTRGPLGGYDHSTTASLDAVPSRSQGCAAAAGVPANRCMADAAAIKPVTYPQAN